MGPVGCILHFYPFGKQIKPQSEWDFLRAGFLHSGDSFDPEKSCFELVFSGDSCDPEAEAFRRFSQSGDQSPALNWSFPPLLHTSSKFNLWNGLKSGEVGLSYSLESDRFCMLLNDDDLDVMFELVSSSGLNRVKVSVFDAGLFPICFAIVDAETNVSWSWFLGKLRDILSNERDIVFFSDRNDGICSGIANIFPRSPHSYCLYHLKMNLRHALSGLKGGFKEHLVTLFSLCAHAPNEKMFDDLIADLKRQGKVLNLTLSFEKKAGHLTLILDSTSSIIHMATEGHHEFTPKDHAELDEDRADMVFKRDRCCSCLPRLSSLRSGPGEEGHRWVREWTEVAAGPR
ncbi:hypothetical protein RHSIM_Rhsim10G0070300 [Rhododendron simsii]|uniref:MULE transposase domain-containing protein n=1 Tax=Rhododendron simsii TaxID=118357 RepID=A0A834GBZ7_RHOSS|nr:hypothetical protein RHSIM_Rhsim10G0070300 [Rhododendron simsii]